MGYIVSTVNVDLLLDILKVTGFLIGLATAISGHFKFKTWEETTIEPVIIARGHSAQKTHRMTKWGWVSFILMVTAFLVATGAHIGERFRAKEKQRIDRQQRETEQRTYHREIARIQQENQAEMAKRLSAQSVQMAEMFFRGRELDTQRAAFLEKAKLAGMDVKIPERSNTFSVSNITAEIRRALSSIPEELRAATAARNQAEAERVATEAKAKELDKAIRPRVLDGWTLIQSVLGQAQREGLITVTNIAPIPTLPDRLVYSRHQTNFSARLERFFGTNAQQQIAFAHGDAWLVSMLPGVLESSTTTNDSYYPKIRIGRAAPNPFFGPALAILSFDPASAELRISAPNIPQHSDITLKPEDRVAATIVDVLRQSVLRSHQ